ncbi:MAG: SMP-30/gluconolactonase/LRE family protein [candidate division FCPU426 bacterium]
MMALYVSMILTEAGGFTAGIEGPACDRKGVLYAVNYNRQGAIGAVSPEGKAEVFVDLPTGSVGNGIRFRQDGRMLIADCTLHNILEVDMASKAVRVFAHSDSLNQPNDICITDSGQVFASDPNWSDNTGKMWRADLDGCLTLLEEGMGTTNGIEVSPDQRTLYVNESVQRRVWAYDLSPEGAVSRKRLFIEFPDFGLDGMRCDIDGNLYITRYGKGVVVKMSPEGKVLLEVVLHGSRPSNLAFGGPDGKTIYVTEVDHQRIEQFRVETEGREWRLWQE